MMVLLCCPPLLFNFLPCLTFLSDFDIPIIASAILQFMSTKGNNTWEESISRVLLLLFICLRLFVNVYDRREGVERKAKDG